MSCPLSDFSFSNSLGSNPSIADISFVHETATLNTDNVTEITNDLKNYVQTTLIPYIDCYINSIGTKLGNGDYDTLVDATRDKIVDKINHLDLNNLDNIKSDLTTKLNKGDYDDLINALSQKIMNNAQEQVNSDSFTQLLNTIKDKVLDELTNITPQITTGLIIGGIIFVIIIFLLIAIYFKRCRK